MPDPDWQPKNSDTPNANLTTNAKEIHSDVLVSAVTKSSSAKASPLKVSETLAREQQMNPTLRRCFHKLRKDFVSRKGQKYSFVKSNDVLYRNYKLSMGRAFKQVVVPKKLREQILRVAHESVMAGHQGVRKKTDRVLQEYFWPDLRRDVRHFVKTCGTCRHNVPKIETGSWALAGGMSTCCTQDKDFPDPEAFESETPSRMCNAALSSKSRDQRPRCQPP